jgi:tetratricopeptide (TPR) repeat protein
LGMKIRSILLKKMSRLARNRTDGRMKKALVFSVLLVTILSVSSCATEKNSLVDFDEAPLMGMVYDYENLACADTLIIIDGKERTRSDINGRFIIDNLTQGTHLVTAKKGGYETLSFEFDFRTRSQVLYLRIISFHQLLKQLEDAIAAREWEEADSLISRAEAIKKGDPIQLYLKAIYRYETGNPESSVQILLEIIEEGYNDPVIYLTLSNIYQYKLNDLPEAIKYLEEYLKYEDDRDTRKRYEMMKERLTESSENSVAGDL